MTDDNADSEQERMRKVIDDAMRAQYEPTGLVLHPIDHAVMQVAEVGETDPDKRVAAQKAIADAFGVDYWVLGVDGYKAPLRVRMHPRRLWWRLRSWTRRTLARLPLVYDYGYVPRDSWMYEGSTDRRGRWWVQVGPLRVGWGWDEENW